MEKSREEVANSEEARLLKSIQRKKDNKNAVPWSERNKQLQQQYNQKQKGNAFAFNKPVQSSPGHVKQGQTTVRMKNTAQVVQLKEHNSFTAWLNWVLKSKNISITNLTQDLSDGIILCKLAETLLNKKLKYFENPKLPFHNMKISTLQLEL
jgi:hypothetical protein